LRIRKLENLVSIKFNHIREISNLTGDSFILNYYLSDIEKKQNILNKLSFKFSWVLKKTKNFVKLYFDKKYSEKINTYLDLEFGLNKNKSSYVNLDNLTNVLEIICYKNKKILK
jgi:hypothetical protein